MKQTIAGLACASLLAVGFALPELHAQTPTPPAPGAPPAGRGAGRGQPPAGDQGGRGGRGGGGGRGAAAPAAPVESGVPDLAGIWNGGGGARPVNSENQPWNKGTTPVTNGNYNNFPVLNERGEAFMKAFDEAIAPKYDCVPSSSPALQYDPYNMQVVQWPDRVIFRYEKDDQTRTVWLDGRKPTIQDYTLQGFSVGKYEGDALIVTTDHFLFDITGLDDYNGIPSSSLKKITERYWKENGELKLTLTLEDPLILRKPAGYTTRWLAQRPGYQLQPWECDPETSRAPIKMMVPKYK